MRKVTWYDCHGCFLFVTLVGSVLVFVFLFLVVNQSSPYRRTQENPSSPYGRIQENQSTTLNVSNEQRTRQKTRTRLAVFVMSAPKHARARTTVRHTWARNPPEGVIVRFVVGTVGLEKETIDLLLEENAQYSDVVLLESLLESYESLTSKLLGIFEYAARNVDLEFLMKVDEDSFVRLDQIVVALAEKPKERLYWGFFLGRSRVVTTGKWAETEYRLCDRYIPYAVGGGYVVSRDLVEYVANNSKFLKKYKNEDASLGTWLGPLDIERVHDTRFNTEGYSRGCFNAYIVTHDHSEDEMYEMFDNLRYNGTLCSEEWRYILSFEYNWDVKPSLCCFRIDDDIP